jgi:hypothetical protein
MEKCFDGWARDNGNISGRCCCNCKYQRPIVGHPWNKRMGSPIQGPMDIVIGFGCNIPDAPNTVFFEFKHGMCENHDWDRDEEK